MKYFDKIVSLVMRRCDVLYGFAGASLFSGQKILSQGGRYLLDRACPHIESRIHNVKYLELGRVMIKQYFLRNIRIDHANVSEDSFVFKNVNNIEKIIAGKEIWIKLKK